MARDTGRCDCDCNREHVVGDRTLLSRKGPNRMRSDVRAGNATAGNSLACGDQANVSGARSSAIGTQSSGRVTTAWPWAFRPMRPASMERRSAMTARRPPPGPRVWLFVERDGHPGFAFGANSSASATQARVGYASVAGGTGNRLRRPLQRRRRFQRCDRLERQCRRHVRNSDTLAIGAYAQAALSQPDKRTPPPWERFPRANGLDASAFGYDAQANADQAVAVGTIRARLRWRNRDRI